MFPFDYDRDYLQPEPERETRDPDNWVWNGSEEVYVGDDV